jgi:hypothetical protein
MKNHILLAALLMVATYAVGQTPTVIVNGTVSANGTITGSGVNSAGPAGGQLSLTGGIGPLITPSTFNLAAPALVPASYQAVVPAAVANGIWRGSQAVMPTATATVNASSPNNVTALTVTSGSGYTGSSGSCTIHPSGGGAGPCTFTINATLGQVTAVSVSGGSGYTSAATVTFPTPPGGAAATGVLSIAPGTGAIISASITSGSGYATAPGCLILPVLGVGSGATCSASFAPGAGSTLGSVSGLTVTNNGGSGYTSGATVSFVPQIAMGFTQTGDDATVNSSTNALSSQE